MSIPKAEDLARFDEGLTAVQTKMSRIFIGACFLNVIIVTIIVPHDKNDVTFTRRSVFTNQLRKIDA